MRSVVIKSSEIEGDKHNIRQGSKESGRPMPMSQYALAEVAAAAKANRSFIDIVHRERARLLKKRQKGPAGE